MLQEIPLIAIPNQSLSVTVNNQTLNITVNSIYINNKTLIGTNADPDDNTEYKTLCSLTVGTNPIIYNTPAIHAQYINQYPNDNFNGYLFFYVEGVDFETNDNIKYQNFGATTHLYYSDFDAVDVIYQNWIKNNSFLLRKLVYGSN